MLNLKQVFATLLIGYCSLAMGLEGCSDVVNAEVNNIKLGMANQLKLNRMNIDDACAISLAGWLANKDVVVLRLASNQIGDTGIEALAKTLETNTKLKALVLDDNTFNELGAKALGDMLMVNRTLSRIDLGNNHLTLSGVTDLIKGLTNNRGLRSLYLYGNHLGNDGVKVCIHLLKNNKNITYLHLGNNNIDSGQKAFWQTSLADGGVKVIL